MADRAIDVASQQKAGPRAAGAGDRVFDAHRLLQTLTPAQARQHALTKDDHACLQAALAVLAAPVTAADLAYASCISRALPRKNLARQGAGLPWSGRCEAGAWQLLSGHFADGHPVGIPYGAKARLVLIYLQTQALLHQSADVALGDSMHAWLRSMSQRAVGGMTYRMIAMQSQRIASCRLQMHWHGSATAAAEGAIIDWLLMEGSSGEPGPALPSAEVIAQTDRDPRVAPGSFPPRAILSPLFMQVLQARPIAVRRSALRQISDNSLAMDLYVWLCERLPTLTHTAFVPWAEIVELLGHRADRLRQMRAKYLGALGLALAVYPQARVTVSAQGWSLHPAPAAIDAQAMVAARPLDEAARKALKASA